MDYEKYLNKSKEKFNELDQIKKDAESIESTMMKPKMKHIDSEVQDIDSINISNQNNEERQLAKFNLCRSLIVLLGEDIAVANLYKLYNRHPEMFDSKDDLKKVIEQVLNEPDFITKNPTPKNDKDFMVYKQLNKRKVADIGIRNDEMDGNIIFHANKKDISNSFYKAKAQMLVEASSAVAAPTRLDHYADKSNDLSRCNKALSASDNDIIQQSISKSQEQNDSNDESNESTHTRRKP